MMGNDEKVREGKERKNGEKSTSTPSDVDVEEREEHPGITYTKSGAMRQKCLIRPPPSDIEEVNSTSDTNTIHQDDTASIHQHGDYAGPNLTAPPPQHYSPGPTSISDSDEYGRNGEGQGLRLDSPGRLGAYDLHGGFPTGAPSPSPGARGAEVLDPFERTTEVRAGQRDPRDSGPGQNR